MAAQLSDNTGLEPPFVGQRVEEERSWLAREFLGAVSGAERLAWPAADRGQGRGSAARARSAAECRRKKAHEGAPWGEPSLGVFREEG